MAVLVSLILTCCASLAYGHGDDTDLVQFQTSASGTTDEVDEQVEMSDTKKMLDLIREVDVATAKVINQKSSIPWLKQRGENKCTKGNTSQRLYMFGAHHKSGTEIARDFAKYTSQQLEEKQPCVREQCRAHLTYCDHAFPLHPYRDSNVWFACHITPEYFEGLRNLSKNDDWRAVHMIRDPVALVVSGYLYHQKSADLNGLTPAVKRMNISDAMEAEANFALNTSLKEMVDSFHWAEGNDKVLTIRMEDFTGSSNAYDSIVNQMYTHLGFCDTRVRDSLVMISASDDLHRGAEAAGGSSHVASEKLKNAAEAAFKALPADLLKKLNHVRQQLGYETSY